MSNFIYRLKKLNEYNGLAEIRETDCEECVRNNEDMEIRHGLEIMILSPEELISKRIGKVWIDPKSTKSGKGYYLWTYIWDTEEDDI